LRSPPLPKRGILPFLTPPGCAIIQSPNTNFLFCSSMRYRNRPAASIDPLFSLRSSSPFSGLPCLSPFPRLQARRTCVQIRSVFFVFSLWTPPRRAARVNLQVKKLPPAPPPVLREDSIFVVRSLARAGLEPTS